MGMVELLVLTGALAGGFVNGLSGFGTGLSALPFWLYAVPPAVAAPLVVACSVIAQLQTLPAIWGAIAWRRVLPFVAGGLVGVPIGAAILVEVSPQTFKTVIGGFLIVYCGFMLLRGAAPVVSWGGRLADGAVGFGGGILGGFAGLSGPLPTIWAGLRGWGKDEKRSVFQTFNLSILFFAGVSQAWHGFMTAEVGRLVLIALPGTLLGAWAGRRTYARLGDGHYDRIVLVLLFLSGISIVATALLTG